MKYIDKKIIYISSLIIGLIVLIICFIYRYSYINFLGFNRPLQVASLVCGGLGIVGSIVAIIDGVDRHFRGNILTFALLNLIMVFTYPILISTENALKPPANPFETQSPDKGYSTKFKDDSSFILAGELYKFPVTLSDFKRNKFSINPKKTDNGYLVDVRRVGDSFDPKPTWFTDGNNNELYKEYYFFEALISDNKKDELENQPIDVLKISKRDINRDFEIMGIKLEDNIYQVNNKFADRIRESEDNQNNPIKKYFIDTSDGYIVQLNAHNGVIESIEIHLENKN